MGNKILIISIFAILFIFQIYTQNKYTWDNSLPGDVWGRMDASNPK